MAVTSYKAPGTAASIYKTGYLWSSVNNAKIDNSSYTSSHPYNTTSDWLRFTNFGFSTSDIPDGSTINGIEVEFDAYGPAITSDTIYLLDSTGRVGDNKGEGVNWTSSRVTYSRGAADDDWNAGLTDSDIRASTFGIDVSCTPGFFLSGIARVYYAQIRITYTPSTNIKTINGISYSNIKTWNGISMSNIKSWDSLTN